MKVTARLLAVTILCCTLPVLHGQPGLDISKPQISLKDGKVLIEYDLLNTTRSDKFTVRIELTGQDGQVIPARSLEGDLGDGVPGGINKKILWDIEADSIFLNEEIFVEVFATPETPPITETTQLPEKPVETQPESTEPAEPVAEEKPDESTVQTGRGTDETEQPGDPSTRETDDPSVIQTDEGSTAETREPPAEMAAGKKFSRTGLILQSVVLPGLGLSRANPGKPHWLKGVAAYSCLGGSFYLNRKAYSTYESYQEQQNPDEMDNLFSQAQSQKTTSEILGYAAIGIWVADLVWTIAGTSGLNKDQMAGTQKGISLGTTMEPLSRTPLIALRYQF
jgi:hypothetical protein